MSQSINVLHPFATRSLRLAQATQARHGRPGRASYSFERGVTKTGGDQGWADVWRENFVVLFPFSAAYKPD